MSSAQGTAAQLSLQLTAEQQQYLQNVLYIYGSFYEYARDGILSSLIELFFGKRINEPVFLDEQPQSLLELHLAQPPLNIVTGRMKRRQG